MIVNVGVHGQVKDLVVKVQRALRGISSSIRPLRGIGGRGQFSLQRGDCQLTFNYSMTTLGANPRRTGGWNSTDSLDGSMRQIHQALNYELNCSIGCSAWTCRGCVTVLAYTVGGHTVAVTVAPAPA